MKKVLASVLAGTMILGMASMASAAHVIGLEKAVGTDREYDLPLYYPTGDYVTDDNGSTTTIAWSRQLETAYNTYEKAYDKFMGASDDFGTLRVYFADCKNSNKDTIMDVLDDFLTAIGNDTNTSISGLGGVWAGSAPSKYQVANITLSDVTSATAPFDNTTLGTDCITFASNRSPEKFMQALRNAGVVTTTPNLDGFGNSGDGVYEEHKSSWDISDPDTTNFVTNMYTYGEDHVKEVRVNVWVKHGDSIRADVNKGKVSVSKKLVEKNWVDEANQRTDTDLYMFTLKAKADVRDYELSDFEVEFDVDNDDHSTYFLKGQVAYSDYREVDPDDRLTITKSDRLDNQEDGCIFYFNEPIDEEARINCNDYVDLYFDGNYGTDYENLLVVNDGIQEVEDFFQDYDIDYYDFVGTPKFARDVRIIIDADKDAYIYEYDKKTGDVVDITDECEYNSNGMEFKRKSFKTYVILEEPYEGGNVKAEKEPVAEEPEDEPKDSEEPADDTANEGSKPNPGTGAYPLF